MIDTPETLPAKRPKDSILSWIHSMEEKEQKEQGGDSRAGLPNPGLETPRGFSSDSIPLRTSDACI